MKFTIITHVLHTKKQGQFFAYGPYVQEMNIWLNNVQKVEIVAPFQKNFPTVIDLNYEHNFIRFSKIKSFNAIGIWNKLYALFLIPKISFTIFKAMQSADHIHLRCPGNIGLLGCIVQILFPKKSKTAKYAGNWDPKAQQPVSYKIQKWILSNTFLTKNMRVLVYGEWPNQSKNIKPFFTASYSENEKEVVSPRDLSSQITFLFVGTLSEGKQPLYAIQLVEKLILNGFDVRLEMFGEGIERKKIEAYIAKNNLRDTIILRGNKTKEELKVAYKKSHFLLLPSKSEGWPKVVAEAMFWGCVPIATPVSCVSNMLDNENRGLFLKMNLESDVKNIGNLISEQKIFHDKSKNASNWSRNYTLDRFETEIQKLLS